MGTTSDMNAICSQLLTPEDLNISEELFNEVVENTIVTNIANSQDTKCIKIYSTYQLFLSSITPILHDIGFMIIDEVTYNISKSSKLIYVSRFNLRINDKDDLKKIEHARRNLELIITRCLKDPSIKHSKVFSLVCNQNFDFRKLMLVKAFIEYLDQSVLTINSVSVLNTLTSHHEITDLFVDYFCVKFDPRVKKREEKLKAIIEDIEEKIKEIPQIMDDRILKLTFSLLQSLLRTNYYLNKETIALKIDTKNFGINLKGLQPNLENFIFHPDFYGVHLRMSNISRGGLRWSDRHEDYRQEIKSLMITQEGKNSIIIPDGSKGGFVINKDNSQITKEYFQEIYSMYINANLDLVDNMVDSEVVRDEKIIAYDEDDPYFVVAADKGTASMSDVANEIAISRNYWLGDAFASGGSNGYGHKDLGITARGAIMSTKRFFIEKGIDIYKDTISVMGIGSMSGDVFGNGLIETDRFELLGAIGHKEIFVDPNPDLQESFKERKRLFNSKNGGWSNYDKSKISKGGGVFLRSDKEIELSPEMKKLLNTKRKFVSGEELCVLLLKMNVDLLFNGGVGTYVKASDENSIDIGDKQNEAVRIDATDLKAKIVSEGGNLGFTQRARIEYALGGGRINIDGIDNAGGVDTSDHEVNLKILLNTVSSHEDLCSEERQNTLRSMTDQVVNLVLESNYNQSLAISLDEFFSKKHLNSFIRAIEVLEKNVDAFNRASFFIPKNENIQEVVDINDSIVRPVLCSLLSYSKIFIKKILLDSKLIDEQFALPYLYRYFPKSFISAYERDILNHPLKREIIATKIADVIINSQGCTFISDYERLGKERFLLKIQSYLVAKRLFGSKGIRYKIASQDYIMSTEKQYELINKLEYILSASTRWMVKYLKKNQLDAAHILDHKDELFSLLEQVHNQKIEVLIEGDDRFNLFFSVIDYLRFAIPAIVIKSNTNHQFKDVVVIFYSLIHEFNILDIIVALNKIKVVTSNDLVLRNQVLQFIEFIVVHYTKKILDFQRVNEEADVAFANFINNEKSTFYKVRDTLDLFMTKENKDIKEIAITVNQMMVSLL
ncbi:NAD-glutamate dehydrogenase domain-containing protein [Halarcobacter anaerophilus]|jgi:glutamate dehydrogenase|uniref:Glutamate dehydrogenase n=1 Tax=Halarcobacter anaerophilus TaxID=877500 RepID=A0A4Q0XZX5_9BACT|nr:NAD-glutamate dehydrogenase domain-containing protein [Halarcobacter anaerophilus]QDF28552.1 NAD-specific glutamate dehydrogenase [Halarcobacter anaerophilus]RXJ63280.1 glutamate dehydrogenase [Halarcobacter anaerophilus]